MAADDERIVVVADDDDAMRLLCRVNLELDGSSAAAAATLEEARDWVRTGGVRAVLLDVNVAGEDGRELLDELKADHPELPILMLTGAADFAPRRHAPNGIIPKPFDPAAMVERVKKALRSTGAARSGA